jgi:hypothetical protein
MDLSEADQMLRDLDLLGPRATEIVGGTLGHVIYATPEQIQKLLAQRPQLRAYQVTGQPTSNSDGDPGPALRLGTESLE